MATAPHFRLFARTEQAALLDLPWALPLEDWPEERLVDIERGIGRHVVRFVELNGAYFALKELPPRIAAREYRLLARTRGRGRSVGRSRRCRRRPDLRRRPGAASGPDHALPRVRSAVPPDPRPRDAARHGAVDPQCPLGAARAPPHRRLLLGRLLALERTLPPRRRRTLCVSRRRRDERDCTSGSRTARGSTTSTSPRRTSPASCTISQPSSSARSSTIPSSSQRASAPRMTSSGTS